MCRLDLVGLRCSRGRGWLAVVCLVAGGVGPTGVLTGPAAAHAAPALDAAVHAVWRGVPLEAWIDQVTQLAGVPVIRDRRIDPGLRIERDGGGEPLADVLEAVAAAAGARVAVLDSTVRIVPAHGAGDVVAGERARLADIATLPAAGRRVVTHREAWQWPSAARPRDLVAAAAAAAGIEIEGLEKIPHDHLPAARLPPLELGERLDLLLAHYDLRVTWTARGAAATGPAVRAQVVPLTPPGDRVSVAADADRRAIDDGVAGRRPLPRREAGGRGRMPAADAVAEPRFTLRLEATLEQAVATLASRFGLEPAINREALAARGILPGEIVRVEVRDARRDELLDAIVAPLGLGWRIEDRRLVIEPAAAQ
jgi:hypothetical protein